MTVRTVLTYSNWHNKKCLAKAQYFHMASLLVQPWLLLAHSKLRIEL